MMPLCTTAIRWPVSTCGWALRSLGAPWVAHRVCPMPVCPASGRRAAAGQPVQLGVQVLDPAGLLGGPQLARLADHRHAGRVVAAVFQPAQALHHHLEGRPGTDVANDAAHALERTGNVKPAGSAAAGCSGRLPPAAGLPRRRWPAGGAGGGAAGRGALTAVTVDGVADRGGLVRVPVGVGAGGARRGAGGAVLGARCWSAPVLATLDGRAGGAGLPSVRCRPAR